MRYAALSASTILAIVVWGSLVFAALDQGWGKSSIAEKGELSGFELAAREIAEQDNQGNVSFILIESGAPVAGFHLSKGEEVNAQSVFQVASLGKWVTAWGVMALVEDGQVDIDAPVSDYLTRWQLPTSEFDASGVTVRRLLSHTAGLTDGLGYNGFATKQERQTIEASLTQSADASPGKDGRTILGTEPGSGFAYSGGGYSILQLLVEEVSGKPFSAYMQDRVFAPLDMERTSFDHDKAIVFGLAENFGTGGTTEPFGWYTALAATSLFTTSEDLAKFVAAQAPDAANPVLSQDTLALIRTPHASEMGADIWGLGTMLYAPNNTGDFIIGHDGSNEPAINTSARLDPSTGDGIVILSTGNPMLATRLAGEWVFWKTGNVDTLTFAARLPTALLVFVGGAFLILVVAGLAIWRRARAASRNKRTY